MTWWLFVGLLLLAACAHHVWRTWPRRNRRRTDVLGKPFDDPRNVSGKYMETLRNNGRFW